MPVRLPDNGSGARGFSALRTAARVHHQQHRPSSEDWTSRMNIGEKTDEQMDRGALAALYEETFRNFEEGTIIEGGVVAISKDKVVVDIGYKSEGMIPADQFSPDDLSTLKVGDRIQVYIEDREDAEGNLVLSKEKADKMKVW